MDKFLGLKSSPSSIPKSTGRKVRGSHLIEGQRFLGNGNAFICKECKMEYIRGNRFEELNHIQYHKRQVSVLKNTLKYVSSVKNGLIRQISGTSLIVDLSSDIKTLEHIWSVVNEDVKHCLQLPHHMTHHSDSKVMAYISQDWIVGVIWIHPITIGHETVSNSNMQVMGVNTSLSWPCMLGVELIWVRKQNRRKGIAMLLLDSAAMHVDPSQVAFSQSTESGSKLAESFCRMHSLERQLTYL